MINIAEKATLEVAARDATIRQMELKLKLAADSGPLEASLKKSLNRQVSGKCGGWLESSYRQIRTGLISVLDLG